MKISYELARLPAWQLWLTTLVVLIGIRVLATAGGAVGGAAGGVEGAPSVLRIALLLGVQHGMILAVLFTLARRNGMVASDFGFRAIGSERALRDFGFGLLLVPMLAILNVILVAIYWVVSGAPVENSQLPFLLGGEKSLTGDILFFAAAALLAPLVEEMAFRGLLFAWLAARISLRAAGLLSAFAFAVVHMPITLVPLMLCFGWLMAVRYRTTGSLWSPILAHCAFNSTNLLLFYLVRDVVAESIRAETALSLLLPLSGL